MVSPVGRVTHVARSRRTLNNAVIEEFRNCRRRECARGLMGLVGWPGLLGKERTASLQRNGLRPVFPRWKCIALASENHAVPPCHCQLVVVWPDRFVSKIYHPKDLTSHDFSKHLNSHIWFAKSTVIFGLLNFSTINFGS